MSPPEFCTVSPVLESSRMMRSPFRNVRKEDPSPIPKKSCYITSFGFQKISVLDQDQIPLDPYELGLLDPDPDP
jgi:hypothetical protein